MAKAAAAKRATKKSGKSAESAPPQSEAPDLSPGQQPGKLRTGRSNVSPETKLDFYNQARIALAAYEKIHDEAKTAQAEYRAVLKKAKAAGVNQDAIKEVLKLRKQEVEDIAIDFADLNEMLVLAGIAVPVKQVSPDITQYSIQMGLFDGKSVAAHVEDKEWDKSAPSAEKPSNKVNETEIASARAKGVIAANRGFSAEKNPWLLNGADPGHPLAMAWEDARQKRTAERAAKELSGATH